MTEDKTRELVDEENTELTEEELAEMAEGYGVEEEVDSAETVETEEVKQTKPKKEKKTPKKTSKTKKIIIGAVVAVAAVALIILGTIYLPYFVSMSSLKSEYKEWTTRLANRAPVVYDYSSVNIEGLTASEIDELVPGDGTTIKDIVAENIPDLDVSKIVGFGEYIKNDWVTDREAFKNADGTYGTTTYYVQTEAERYYNDIATVFYLMGAKDAIADLYKSTVTENNFEVESEALKTDSIFELRDAISSIVSDADLAAELYDLSDKMYRIIWVTQSNIEYYNKVASTGGDEVLSSVLALTGNSDVWTFDNLSDEVKELYMLASADNIAYNAKFCWYQTSEEESTKDAEMSQKIADDTDKVIARIGSTPGIEEEEVSVEFAEFQKKLIEKSLLQATDNDKDYIARKLDANYWLTLAIAGGETSNGGYVGYATDSDVCKDYYITVADSTGKENESARYSWVLAHKLVYNYIDKSIGDEDTEMDEAAEALANSYGNLILAIETNLYMRFYPFSDYTSQ